MSQTQQEAYQVIFKNTPQKLYQAFRMLTMMQQVAQRKQKQIAAETTKENDWKKFKKLREELELPDNPELKGKFMELPRDQRLELIRDCEKKLLIKAGEKDYEFLISSNKMLAEPQILNKDVNLDQLGNMLTEYGLQFHIKELPDQTKELYFFSKDANIANRAINRTLETIAADPECITKPTLANMIEQAKEQAKEKVQDIKEAGVVKGTTEATKEAEDAFNVLSLFDDDKGGIDL